MYRLARNYYFTGVRRAWSLQLFRAQSTKPGAWNEPMRKVLLSVYRRLNEAIAR